MAHAHLLKYKNSSPLVDGSNVEDLYAVFLGKGSDVKGSLFLDAPLPWQINFQDPASTSMEGIIDLHHEIMFYLFMIVVFVVWMMAVQILNFSEKEDDEASLKGYLDLFFFYRKQTHNISLEWGWTIIPTIVLALIAGPSFSLLYALDEVSPSTDMVLKVLGNQWFWTYEYSPTTFPASDVPIPTVSEGLAEEPLIFDSYLIAEDDLKIGQLRLLEVDLQVVLPSRTNILLLITSLDVLHS